MSKAKKESGSMSSKRPKEPQQPELLTAKPWVELADSYLSAAWTLYMAPPNSAGRMSALAPVFFLHRHGIELLLKACLIDSDPDNGPDRATEAGHSLSKLLGSLEVALPGWVDDDVHRLVATLNAYDPSSFDSRYPGNRTLTAWTNFVGSSATHEDPSGYVALKSRRLRLLLPGKITYQVTGEETRSIDQILGRPERRTL